jgi:hypothetical protein
VTFSLTLFNSWERPELFEKVYTGIGAVLAEANVGVGDVDDLHYSNDFIRNFMGSIRVKKRYNVFLSFLLSQFTLFALNKYNKILSCRKCN